MRRADHYVGRRVIGIEVRARRRRGRPKRRWLDRVGDYIKEKGLSERDCSTELNAGVYHQTSTPHIIGNKRKKKKLVRVYCIY